MRQCAAYIRDPYTTLTFDLGVKFLGFLHARNYILLDIEYPFGLLIYMYMSRTFMIPIRRWPLTSRSNIKGFDMPSCLNHILLSFNIVIPYLAHECIAIGRCVAYIHCHCRGGLVVERLSCIGRLRFDPLSGQLVITTSVQGDD